jgi:hypothetical protein
MKIRRNERRKIKIRKEGRNLKEGKKQVEREVR